MFLRLSHLVFWSVFFAFFLFAFSILLEIPTLCIIAARGVQGTGEIIAIDRANHGLETVRCRIGNEVVFRTVAPSGGRVGDQVTVYYDPDKPSRFAIESPMKLVQQRLIFCLAGAFFIASALTAYRASVLKSFSVWGYFRWRPRTAAFLISCGAALGSIGTLIHGEAQGLVLMAVALGLCGACVVCWSAVLSPRDARWGELLLVSRLRLGMLLILIAGLLSVIAFKL